MGLRITEVEALRSHFIDELDIDFADQDVKKFITSMTINKAVGLLLHQRSLGSAESKKEAYLNKSKMRKIFSSEWKTAIICPTCKSDRCTARR
jgi:hypothetical protein